MSLLNKSKRTPLLCCVTDLQSLSADESTDTRAALLDKIEAAAFAGVDWIQIREKQLSARECTRLTRQALQRSADSAVDTGTRARIIVNDRLDVALATQTGGVHFGESSLPPQEARQLVLALHREEDFLIGVSCHSLEAAKSAERGGADYLFFGPVFETPSKAAYGPPQGLHRLAEVCRSVSIPVLAIGGITLENTAVCFSAGASGIAAIRLFQDSEDLSVLVQALRKAAT
ncbi:MAG TPA: thiamine phosphate synthase [Candidatus Acidoferrum sp.]|nr:thiamine phosphate synthase [Candidatus Acidoferrum sp.]